MDIRGAKGFRLLFDTAALIKWEEISNKNAPFLRDITQRNDDLSETGTRTMSPSAYRMRFM